MSAEQIGTEYLLSVILPAHNEASLIGRCLFSVLASDWQAKNAVQVIVVANGCSDETANRARDFCGRFAERGWRLDVLDLPQGGKLAALNAGDAVAQAGMRVYLDADVTVDAGLLSDLADSLAVDAPRYASGAVRIQARGWISRAYARIWRKVPFMTEGVPGCGVFAVNEAGRGRWQDFPDIISDDTFVRLSFAPQERKMTQSGYDWPIAEGFAALAKVRRRQDAGVDEIKARFGGLIANDDKAPFPLSRKLNMAMRDPIGFLVYSAVALYSKLTRNRAQGWSRGR